MNAWFEVPRGWLQAVMAGHARVAAGLGLAEPVYVMLSDRTVFGTKWAEDMTAADVVLDVEVLAQRATRLGRHGTALIPDPEHRWRVELRKARWLGNRDPIAHGCPCPACRDHTRGYIHYLVREKELTGARLVTLHNLTFMALLMEGIRAAVQAGELDAYAKRVLRGQAPYSA